jgi:hypothetical protein
VTIPATVYVAVIEDRHTGPEPYVFSSADLAVAYARRWAADFAHEPDDVEEELVDGRLYHANYSEEGDCVWVVEKRIDDAEGTTP